MHESYNPYCSNFVVEKDGKEAGQRGSLSFPCFHLDTWTIPCPCHWHEEFELIYLLEGDVTFQVADHFYHLEKGDGIFINAGAVHANDAGSGGCYREHVFQFHPRLLYGSPESVIYEKYIRPMLRCEAFAALPLYCAADGSNEAVEHIRQAWMLMEEEPPMYEMMVREEISALYRDIFARVESLLRQEKPVSRRRDESIKRMMEFLQGHMCDDVTMDELSAFVHLSPRECQRTFQSFVGTTPFQYLNHLRLNEAATLLRDSDMNVTEICFQCGYRDASYFARQFKQRFGLTPREYRSGQGGASEAKRSL